MADEAKITLSAQNNASAEIQKINADLKALNDAARTARLDDLPIIRPEAFTSITTQATAAQQEITKTVLALEQMGQSAGSVHVPDIFANMEKESQAAQGGIQALQATIKGGEEETAKFGNIAQVAFGASLGMLGVQSIQAVVQKLVAFGEASVEAAAKLQQIQNMAEIVFGNTFPQAQQAMQGLGAEMGRSSTLLLGYKSSLDLVAQGVDVNTKTADAMSTQLTQLAVDMDKAFGGGQEKAIMAISQALEGSGRSLRGYTITMTSATLNEYLASQGVKQHITDLDAQSQAIVKWHYLMDQTTKIQELAIKNTGNLHDSTEKLSSAWFDFESRLGSDALPTATKLVQGLTTAVDLLTSAMPSIEAGWNMWINTMKLDFPFLTEMMNVLGFIDGHTAKPALNMPSFGPGNEAGAAEFAKHQDDWLNKLSLNSSKAGTAQNKLQKQLEQTQTTLENLNNTYKNKVDEINNKLQQLDDTHTSTMADLKSQMEGVADSVQSLKASYAEAMQSINESEASALQKSQTNLDRLSEQLDKKNQEINKAKGAYGGNGSVSVQLQDELADLQTKYDAALAGQQKAMAAVSPDVKAQYAKDQGMTEVEQQIAKDEEKRTKENKTFAEKMAHYDDEMKKIVQKTAVENLSYDMARQQMDTTEARLHRFHDAWVADMGDMAGVTKDQLEAMRHYIEGVSKGPTEAQSKASAKAAVAAGGYKQAVADAHDTHIAKINETTSTLNTFGDQLTTVLTNADETTSKKMASMTAAVNAFMQSLSGLNAATTGASTQGASSYSAPPLDPYAIVAAGGAPIGEQAGAMSAALRLKNAKQSMQDSQVQNAVKAEIRFGDVHIYNSNDEKVLANTIARQIDLLQVGSS